MTPKHDPPPQIGREKPYDEHLYPRGPQGLSRVTVGAIVVALAVILTYLAFAKSIPFVGPDYELKAVFRDASTLRVDSPVRIAGVNVGAVTDISAKGEATEVTFTVKEEGRPVHDDATAEIRPRLFLEGNFFVDLGSGTPGAPELPDGGTIPIARTATAVQLDQVLTALQEPEREDLQVVLQELGTALNEEPSASEDTTQDVQVQGLTGAEAVNESFRYGGAAGKRSAIVADALLGTAPRDLSRAIAASRRVFGTLADREQQLKELITNLNVTTGALAAESSNVSASVRELAPTVEEARPSLLHLSRALPPLRSFARELEPSIRELPGAIDAGNPWLGQTRRLLGKHELKRLARLLRDGTPDLAKVSAEGRGLFGELRRLSRCGTEVLIPTGNQVIDDAGGSYPFSTGQLAYRELFQGLVNLGGIGQPFDGNGTYLRLQVDGGPLQVRSSNPGGGFENEFEYGHAVAPPLGVRPAVDFRQLPPFKPGVKCHENPAPDLNGPASAVGGPMPEVIP
jgi:ABC-type transporter Mla subunit MlaD